MAQCNIDEDSKKKEKLLEELYKLNDEYNTFVRYMDTKLDMVISKVESLNESENIC